MSYHQVMLSFIKNFLRLFFFPKWLYRFTFPPDMCESSHGSTPTFGVVCIFNLSHSCECVVVSHCVYRPFFYFFFNHSQILMHFIIYLNSQTFHNIFFFCWWRKSGLERERDWPDVSQHVRGKTRLMIQAPAYWAKVHNKNGLSSWAPTVSGSVADSLLFTV